MGVREELLAAVRARLDRIGTLGDPGLVLEPGAVNETQRLAEITRDHDGDLQALCLLGWIRWYRSQALPEGERPMELEESLRSLMPCFIAGSGDLPGPLLPALATRALPTAGAMLTEVLTSTDLALISSTVALLQRIVAVMPENDPVRVGWLSNLGVALQARFGVTGTRADLDAAIEIGQAALAMRPDDDPDRVTQVASLANALRLRFQYTGASSDLDDVIDSMQSALAVTSLPPVGQAGLQALRGDALRLRFELTGNLGDLNAAVEACRAAATAIPRGFLDWVGFQAALANVLKVRFERTGVMADLDAAIEAGRVAVDATPDACADRPVFLSNLADALRARFERTGALADLDEAIEFGHAAVDGAVADHHRAIFLYNLAHALRARFERTGALANLDEAIEADRSVLDITAADDATRPVFLAGLGSALLTRFERSGGLPDLDAGIQYFEAALDASPAGHPRRCMYLSNLGIALRARAERTGELADLDAAIEAGRAAVDTVLADHPDRAVYLSNLCNAQQARYERTGAIADLDAAIAAGQSARTTVPADHPHRAALLSNLGSALRARFARKGALADLDAAIEAGRAAVDATPQDHPDRALYLSNYGNALQTRPGKSGIPGGEQSALDAYAQAAQLPLAPPSVRIRAARAAGTLAARSDPGRAAWLLDMAVQLLPETAPRQLERGDQQHALGGFAGLAGDAAALTLADPGRAEDQRAAEALRLVETGRAILLSQALDTRSDLTDLRHGHPELAARFTELRDRLDQPPGELAPFSIDGDNPDTTATPPANLGKDRHRLGVELAAVLHQIRSLGGFATFALPPTTSELLAQGAPGPVVTFNVSAHRSDALLLTETGITSLELPGLAYDRLTAEIRSFHQTIEMAADPLASPADRRDAQKRLNALLEWLWDAAAGPVLQGLGYHHEPRSGETWPRVWWAPGGLLGMFPIHAAGYHREPAGTQPRRTVMDRAVSSYTPTIRALRYARQHVTTSPASEQSLIVAMPVTPGLPGGAELPHVPQEVAYVRSLLPGPVILTEPDTTAGTPSGSSSGIPTRAAVLGYLADCPVAHFACHGASHPADPSRSLLFLHDHDRHPFTVASLTPVNLGHARLAYLSACRTAYNPASTLIDEAIHLTTAFQLAGFPHVIGTLWEINDQPAAEIARTFYTSLRTSEGALDTTQAAQALHHAVRDLRDTFPRTPTLWAAYLHAGA